MRNDANHTSPRQDRHAPLGPAGAAKSARPRDWRAEVTTLFDGLAAFWQGVWSPGLNDSPTLVCLDVREGGQHRF